MRIVGIEAENFKLFADKFDHIQDVENDDLVILNGPNGYGKTSVFDIIEFCLTGEIKRIIYYNQDLEIAKRSAFDNKILIADQGKGCVCTSNFMRFWKMYYDRIRLFCRECGKRN